MMNPWAWNPAPKSYWAAFVLTPDGAWLDVRPIGSWRELFRRSEERVDED